MTAARHALQLSPTANMQLAASVVVGVLYAETMRHDEAPLVSAWPVRLAIVVHGIESLSPTPEGRQQACALAD